MGVVSNLRNGVDTTQMNAMETSWRTFSVTRKDFKTKEDFNDYLKIAKCGVCHNQLLLGDEFDIRPIQTLEETRKFNDSDYTSLAIIVHRKCIEK